MEWLLKPTLADVIAACASARRRVVRRLGLSAEIRARGRRPRSAPGRRHPARRARRSRDRGAVGDPDYAALHGAIALTAAGRTPRCRWTPSSGCIPSMPDFARMYRDKQAPVVHAVATPYRDRSHFDGQDVLESGLCRPRPRAIRLAQPRARSVCRAASASRAALAVGPTTPLVLRGAAPTVRLGAGRAAAGR